MSLLSNSRKICVVLTTRGNYGKMKSVMRNIADDPCLELQVVVGGALILPKYGYKIVDVIRKEFGINKMLRFIVEGENLAAMAKSAGMAVMEFVNALEELVPDVVIVIADRFECLPFAIAASYMNFPVAHIEGGEISGSIDESIRHAITKLAHIHFPATDKAARRIARMGEDPASIFVVGCTSLDTIRSIDLDDLTVFKDLETVYGVGAGLSLQEDYLLVLQHSVTTEYEDNLPHVNETISAIDALNIPTAWIWPNIDAGSDGISSGLRIYRETRRPGHVRFFKSLPIQYYARLLKHAICIVGNSSSGIREASALGTPSVNIGSRQDYRERGQNVIDIGYDRKQIVTAVRKQIAHGPYEPSMLYGNGDSGQQIAQILKRFDFKIQKHINY